MQDKSNNRTHLLSRTTILSFFGHISLLINLFINCRLINFLQNNINNNNNNNNILIHCNSHTAASQQLIMSKQEYVKISIKICIVALC